MSDHVVHLGDCLAGLRTLADDSVDVCVTDPPYEAEAHTKGRRVKVSEREVVSAELPFAAITEAEREVVSAELVRLTRRWILVFCQIEATSRWSRCLVAAGAQYIRTLIWVKPDGQPQLTGDRPGMGYESIVVAHRPGRKRWNGGGRTGVLTHNKGDGMGRPNPHPTTKPIALMRELVSLFSEPSELVLDPFAGSGTTGVACKMLGRRFIGWELNPTYHAIATRRIAGDEAKPRLEQFAFDFATPTRTP